MTQPTLTLLALILTAALPACGSSTQRPNDLSEDPAASDPVTLSFAFVGCNRVGWSTEGDPILPFPPSTANAPQLLQTFKDIKALERPPEYLFLLGDIVRNEESGEVLTQQLQAWQRLWNDGALAGGPTRLIPIMGNHEALKSVKYGGDYYEVPDASANQAWLAWLNRNRHAPQPGNGPTPQTSPGDLLTHDNSQMTYSFDTHTADGRRVHFVLINTDTDSGFSPSEAACYQPPYDETRKHAVPGWIPIDWLQRDLAGARGSDFVFALGHKPLIWPVTRPVSTPSDGRDSVFNCGDKMLARELFNAFRSSSSFVAYLGAHRHEWNTGSIQDTVAQVIAGNGGSPLETGAAERFGFTLIEIRRSGQVSATPYIRPVPDPYYSGVGVQAARASNPVMLKRRP